MILLAECNAGNFAAAHTDFSCRARWLKTLDITSSKQLVPGERPNSSLKGQAASKILYPYHLPWLCNTRNALPVILNKSSHSKARASVQHFEA